MFCPKCGTQLPDGSRFCARCGCAISPAGGGAPAPAPTASRRPGRGRLVALAVAAVAVVGVVVALVTGLAGGTRVPDGTISIDGAMFLTFDHEGADTYLTVGQASSDGSRTPYVRGRLVRDGSNEDGTVWRLEDASSPQGGTVWDWYRVQFPDGAADGELAGAWKFSYGDSDDPDNGYASGMLYMFEEDGGAWYVYGSAMDFTDRHYSYDDARSLSDDDGSAVLTDGLSWFRDGDVCRWGRNGWVNDVTFDLR